MLLFSATARFSKDRSLLAGARWNAALASVGEVEQRLRVAALGQLPVPGPARF
jgi:hypothetical protein